MAILNIPMFVPDGTAFTDCLDGLYEVCKSVGIKYEERYDKFKNTQRTGKMIAIGDMVTAIYEGRLKVTVVK